MRFGIEGVLNDFLLDLGGESPATLKGLRTTPSSALGSSRLKLKAEHFEPVLRQLKRHNIRYFFMIGGNDTMDTIHRVANMPASTATRCSAWASQDRGQRPVRHRPHARLPSAARYVALSVLQGGMLARDMQQVDQYVIFQTVGRTPAGCPPPRRAANGSGRPAAHHPDARTSVRPGQVPGAEADAKVWLRLHRLRRGHRLCRWHAGQRLGDQDKFANVEFGAMGGTSAAMMLHRMISKEFGWRGEFQVAESLQMSAADRVVKLDDDEAYACGARPCAWRKKVSKA